MKLFGAENSERCPNMKVENPKVHLWFQAWNCCDSGALVLISIFAFCWIKLPFWIVGATFDLCGLANIIQTSWSHYLEHYCCSYKSLPNYKYSYHHYDCLLIQGDKRASQRGGQWPGAARWFVKGDQRFLSGSPQVPV